MAFLLRAEAPKQVNALPRRSRCRPRPTRATPLPALAPQVFARTELARGLRNAFQEQSDTRPLPPERIAEPPSVGLAFLLPATIPGVAPPAGASIAARAEPPKVAMEDGSKLPDVPPDAYAVRGRPSPRTSSTGSCPTAPACTSTSARWTA